MSKMIFCVPSVCCLYAQKVLLSVFQKGSFPAHVLCVCPSDIERHPFSQKEISQVCSSKPEILPVTQTCIPTVFPVHPSHLSPKSKKPGMSREKCVPSVFRVYSKCIPNVFQVYSKCVPSVFHKFKCVLTVSPKLIPNVFSLSYCIPKCIPKRTCTVNSLCSSGRV